MKVNIRKHKKKLAAVLILCMAGAISAFWLMPEKTVEDTVREREYAATRDTITVGVESSGLVDAGPNAHSFETGAVVEKLYVKVGSEVKKGDSLASISTENLKELIGTAQDELSDAKAALLQATSAKDVLIAQNNKNKQDGLESVQQEYVGQAELLAGDKTRLEESVARQETALAQLQQQVTERSAKANELQEKVRNLKESINQNILEIGRLNEELLQTEKDTGQQAGSDALEQESAPTDVQSPSVEDQSSLRLKITKLQNENTAMQQEIDAYLADPVFAELEQLREEQQACEAALKSDRDGLALKREEIEQVERQHQQALENQNADNAFSDYKMSEELKTIDETIAKANRSVQAAQERVSRLETLAQNPILYAQLDGVVTSLNYKVGDPIADGKPLCVVGNLDEITMTVPVSAADIGSVSEGQKVNIYVDAYAEQKFMGTVKERLLVANDNGEYPVTISIHPGEHVLLPGMKAYATIILKEKTDVLTLSNKAIALENGQQYVLVRDENGDLVRKQIVTGFSDGRVSEILDGLSENEVVIVQE